MMEIIDETYPRVTEILRRAGLTDDRWWTEEARDLGRDTHQAAEFLDQNDLNWSTFQNADPRVIARIRLYQKFLEETKPEILAIEEPVINHILRYRGTPDRIVRINKREGILDLKSPGKYPWQAIQLALYAGCFNRPMVRWTLHLDEKAKRAKLIEHQTRQDWEVAKAAITIAAWKGEKR